MKKNYALALADGLLLAGSAASAQTWVEMMHDPNVNFYTVQQEFNKYWEGRPEAKGQGYMQFKRWEYFMEPRVAPSGDRSLVKQTLPEFQRYLKSNPAARSAAAGNWTHVGPNAVPDYTSNGIPGAGRINFIRFHPTDPQTMYIGSPSGGLWKTTNGGASWSTNTDQFIVMGMADLAIDPTNPNVMYLATGDAHATDTYSTGVLKSTDGGATWNPTGLAWTVQQNRSIHRLLMHPTNPDILFAGTSTGIYRTTDGGTTWTQVSNAAKVRDMEFKPGDPSVVYAVSTRFYRSTDGGGTFQQVTAGVPSGSVERMTMSVTPANPDYVYIAASRSSDSGFMGMYRSTDGGTTFTTRSNSPNIFGNAATGLTSGGQTWYNLGMAANPANADEVVIGAVVNWRTTDGGQTWTNLTQAYGGSTPLVHSDTHAVEYLPGSSSTFFIGHDGGIHRTSDNGLSFTDVSGNLSITQIYRIGMSATNPDLFVYGTQDVGSNVRNGSTWARRIAGDGMEGFVDYTNDNYVYGESQNGNLRRSSNGGVSFSPIKNNITETGYWVTPWQMHPTDPQTLFAGFSNVWKSTNRGNSWTKLGTLPGGGTIRSLVVAPSNPDVIYVSRGSGVYRTNNGGTTWTNSSTGLPTSLTVTYLTVDPLDHHNLWATCSGYSNGNKVFMSTNGGSTWTNVSSGLPNLPVNCVVYQKGTNDLVYIGTDVGVYYKDNTMASWQPYFNGLPNVQVNELEIFYPTGKIRAATYGRGVWESDIVPAATGQLLAIFNSDNTTICPGEAVVFTDNSPGQPVSWSWSFPGGTPASATTQTVTVTYATAGSLNDVTLTVADAAGNTNVVTDTAHVRVKALPNVNLNAYASICSTGSGITLTGGTPGGGTYAGTGVSGSGPYMFDPAVAGVGTHPISYTYTSPITGCTNTAVQPLEVSVCTGIAEDQAGKTLLLFPNPTTGMVQLNFEATGQHLLQVKVLNPVGQTVYAEQLPAFSGSYRQSIDLSRQAAGLYLLQVQHGASFYTRPFIVQP